jgi:hypothetical protein
LRLFSRQPAFSEDERLPQPPLPIFIEPAATAAYDFISQLTVRRTPRLR